MCLFIDVEICVEKGLEGNTQNVNMLIFFLLVSFYFKKKKTLKIKKKRYF